VAWGGVLAQGALLLPSAALWILADDSLPKVLNLALGVLTWWNAATLLFNLTPGHPFDGAMAWSLFRERRSRTAARGRPRR
jgi:Zn-dependent protease